MTAQASGERLRRFQRVEVRASHREVDTAAFFCSVVIVVVVVLAFLHYHAHEQSARCHRHVMAHV
jgi:hypothetical protein